MPPPPVAGAPGYRVAGWDWAGVAWLDGAVGLAAAVEDGAVGVADDVPARLVAAVADAAALRLAVAVAEAFAVLLCTRVDVPGGVNIEGCVEDGDVVHAATVAKTRTANTA